MLVPKLRFKHEDGTDYPEWEKDKWSALGDFVASGTLSKADLAETGTPCILYGELYTKYGEIAHTIYSKTSATSHTFSQYDDVILPKSGETPEDISTATCVPYDNISLGGDLIVFRHNEKVIGAYLSYLISNRAKNAIASIAQGKSVVHINEKSLANIELSYPDLEEQQKIADFLSTIDEVIAQSEAEVQNLEQQKKAAMQKIFSQEARFKREDGSDYPEWEEKQLGSICDIIGDGLHKAPLYDENGDYYFINGNNLKNGKIIIEKETPKVSVGTLQKSDKSLDTATILMSINGTIGNLAFYQDEKIMLGKSVAYLKVGKNVCKKYIYFVLQTRKIIDSFKLSLTGTTIKNLGLTAIRDTFIFIPCLEEQQKIADFLSAYDEAISYAKQELDKWKELKKGLLQQMFV